VTLRLPRFFLCLCAALFLGLAGAHAQKTITVNTLDFVRAAIAKGDYKIAREILERLLAAYPDDVETNFLLAEIDLRENHLDAAIARFRKILFSHPDIIRVRLDYALALFRAKEDDSAEYNFRLALAADLPETVRDNVMMYLHAILRRRRYQISVAASVAPDTNINAGTDRSEITLFGLPFTPSQELQQKSGVGAIASVGGEYRYPLADDLRWRSGASLWRAEYPGGQFDDMIFTSDMGPEWVLQNWDVSVLGVYTQRWYGNDPFYTGGGPRIEAAYTGFPRWRLAGDAEYLRLGFHSETFQNGGYSAENLTPAYVLTPASFVQPILGYYRQDVTDPAFADQGTRLGLGYHQEITHGITFEVQGELFLSYYDALNPIFGTTRRDRTMRFTGSIYRRDWIVFGFNPVFTYIFTRNDSNQEIFTYNRNQFQIGFTKDF
jgi:outer membrane protein